jgi:glycerol-3-phosphate dehydrogenase
MAEQVVDFALKTWKQEAGLGRFEALPSRVGAVRTRVPVNPDSLPLPAAQAKQELAAQGVELPPEIVERFGGEALMLAKIRDELEATELQGDPEGFPWLSAQLIYGIRQGMVLHLADFYFRRTPLFLARADHGLPWAERLSRLWAGELGASESERSQELENLRREIREREGWRGSL